MQQSVLEEDLPESTSVQQSYFSALKRDGTLLRVSH